VKGTVLDFSIAENSGVVSGDDGNRYTFSGPDWKPSGIQPRPGARVDFIGTDGVAAEVSIDASAPGGLGAEAAATRPSRRRFILTWGAVSLVLLGLAAWAYGVGAEDQRWQLAGLADPFLGHPAPALSVIAGIVISAMLGALVLISRRNRPSPTRAGGRRWHWWWLLIAGWGGYIAGSAVMIAGSAPVVYGGTMHLEFGAPLRSVADVPATCRSVVGKPEMVAQVIPAVDALVAFDLRDGLGSAWGRVALTDDHVPGNDFEPPSVPARPAPYSIYTAPDGSTMTRPAISFVRAYDYGVERLTESGLSGVAVLTAARLHFADSPYVRWMNLTVPIDPWPETYRLTVSWTCNVTGP
jgi:hypothetical protein